MPGCEPNDTCFVIKSYLPPVADNLGTFHTVIKGCACNKGWWRLQAGADCAGHIGSAQTPIGEVDIIVHIPCGGEHCAPDECLQPIRGKKPPEQEPAPPLKHLLPNDLITS